MTMVSVPERIGFFLVPGFSMVALSAAAEPLRAANRLSGRSLYEWRLIGADGAPVHSGSGFRLIADQAIDDNDDGRGFDLVVVASSLEVAGYRDRRVFDWLRRLARRGCRLGAVSTGTLILARAGLLDGYRCTIHWEVLREFTEEFPGIEVTRDLFCIDRDRLTCAGGAAAMDLMLAVIAERHGRAVAADIADNFLHGRIRTAGEAQRMAVQWRYGVTDRRLVKVIALMERHLEDPLPARTLAELAGVSPRQMERLFVAAFGLPPSRFYLELRLKQARRLLVQSADSVLDIALRCGFASASHFGKCYRETFGTTPAAFRREHHRAGGDGRPPPRAGPEDGAGATDSGGSVARGRARPGL